MENHRQLSDVEFEAQFANLTFAASDFTHEAHLRLAWIHIKKYGVDQAVENVCLQIKALVDHLGVSEKYHATVTEAAVRAVYHFILNSQNEEFLSFMEENPQLISEFKALLNSHYSFDIFKSVAARQKFLVPDIAPFDP